MQPKRSRLDGVDDTLARKQARPGHNASPSGARAISSWQPTIQTPLGSNRAANGGVHLPALDLAMRGSYLTVAAKPGYGIPAPAAEPAAAADDVGQPSMAAPMEAKAAPGPPAPANGIAGAQAASNALTAKLATAYATFEACRKDRRTFWT